MEKLEQIGLNTVFALLCLMTVLLFFEAQVVIPYWLQPVGRMHPLLLHLPIGFIVLLVLANLLQQQIDPASFQKMNKFLLLLTALTTVVAAIMGLFLSREAGYASDLMDTHKWFGVGTAYLLYLLAWSYPRKLLYNALLYSSFAGVVIAGHFGASLTHGEDFLVEPLQTEEVVAFDENAPVFATLVQPILKAKCESCHNAGKHKGELDMSTLEKMLKGGEHGPLWEAGQVEKSALIQRAVLPLADKKHMPPKNKPQLTSEELELLKSWIQHGADIAIASTDLAEEDSLKVAIGKYTDAIQAASETVYDFDFASQELIATLNTPYRSVKQKSSTSPALEVIIMGRQTFDFADFQALAQVKEQIVALDMSYAPVGDEVFAVIAQLPNLESLHLNFTNISGDKLSLLNECQRLKTLSLAGTAVSKSQILSLEIPTLEELYLWNTRIADAELAALRTTLSSVNIQSGIERTEEEQLTLTPPVLKSANNVLFTGDEIVLGHKFNGVEIRYTIDGSQPDSTANLYQAPVSFTEEVTIKTIALKSGWKDSEVATFTFRERGHIPQQIEMLQVARMLWRGKGGKGLTDGEQGKVEEIPYFSWIGFQDKPFVALADMGEQLVTLDSIGISYGVQLYDWLRASPPTRVEIYGGDSKDDLNLLVDQSVGFSRKEGDDTAVISYFSVDRSSFRYYKIVAHTIEVLPTWHRHKGNKGRLFVDQLFFVQNNNRQLSFSDQ